MSKSATIFLACIAVIICTGAAIYLIHTSGNVPEKQVGKPLFSFDPDDIRSIIIHNNEGALELKRAYTGWQIMPEPGDLASSDVVRQLVHAANSLVIYDKIPASQINGTNRLAEYGLGKSLLQLDFSGDRDLALLFGKEAVDESRIYVRFENSNDVYIVSNKLAKMIQRPLSEFRDRRITTLQPSRVNRIVLSRPVGEIEFRRDAKGWMIVRPLTAKADDAAINAFVDKLLQTRILDFVADEGGDPGSLGLSEPAGELQFFGEGERVPEIVRLGTSSADKGIYARLIPRNIICTLPNDVAKLLDIDLAGFRDLSLARINLDMVDLIRISEGPKAVSLRRTPEGWNLLDGNITQPAPPDVAQRIAEFLVKARAEKFEPATLDAIEKCGLDHPSMAISFLSVVSENTPESAAGEQLVAEIAFGTPTANGRVPAHLNGSPEISFVRSKTLDQLSISRIFPAQPKTK